MIVYIKEDGSYEYPISFEELQKRFPYVSFCDPIVQSALPPNYFIPYVEDKPNTVLSLKAVLSHGIEGPKIRWEFDQTDEEASKTIYDEIERLTKESDWAIRDDVPDFIRNKYKEYRTKLWDIPNQPGFPFQVIFPEA